jgi:hypothetical protein
VESNPPPTETEAVENLQTSTQQDSDDIVESSPPPTTETVPVENLQTSTQQDSDDVVVTSVTVEVNRESPVAVCDEGECTIKNQNNTEAEKEDEGKEGTDTSKSEEGESQEAKTEGETSEEKNGKSTLAVEKVPIKGGEAEEGEGVEVLISQEPRSNSFSINVANIDTDDYSSSEDESTQPPPYVEPSKGAANATPTTSSGEPPIANGDCPTITVENAEGEKKKGNKDKDEEEGKEKRSGSESSSEGEKLNPPLEGRRCKFILKPPRVH